MEGSYELYTQQRREYEREGEAAPREELRELIKGLQEGLLTSPLLSHVQVRTSPDPEYHIRGYCTAVPAVDSDAMQAELERVWQTVCFQPGTEAHLVSRGADGMILDGITVSEYAGWYLTVRVRVDGMRLEGDEPDPDPDGLQSATLPYLILDEPEEDWEPPLGAPPEQLKEE